MKKQLEDSRQIFQEKVIRNLLQKTMPMADILNQAKQADISMEDRYCAVGTMYFAKSMLNGEHNIKEFLEMVKETYFEKDCQVYLTRFYEKQIVLVFLGKYWNEQAFVRAIRDGIADIEESLERYYDIKTSSTIGGIRKSWMEIPDSYKEAVSIWHGILKTSEPVVFYKPQMNLEKQEDNEKFEKAKKLEEQLLIQIQMGQEEKAEECFYEILHYYENVGVQLADFVSMSLVSLIFDISGTLMKSGEQEQLWEDENIVEYLRSHFIYGSLREAQEVILDYIKKSCKKFAQMNEKQGDRIVLQVKELIEKNLDNEEFSLEIASAKLYFSHNYVRQIFKQITGESFMQYLIRRRMEKAGDLLKNTVLKIQDVAVQTGYSNQRYFASCFKKYYGYTPTEYRILLEKEQ